MPRALKACGTCGTPSPTTPCTNCKPSYSGIHTRTRTEQGLDNRWLRIRNRAIRRQPWCAWPGGCDLEITDRNPLTGDHDEPRSRAPHRTHDETNIVVLCRTHNSRKGNRTLAEVAAAQRGGGMPRP